MSTDDSDAVDAPDSRTVPAVSFVSMVDPTASVIVKNRQG